MTDRYKGSKQHSTDAIKIQWKLSITRSLGPENLLFIPDILLCFSTQDENEVGFRDLEPYRKSVVSVLVASFYITTVDLSFQSKSAYFFFKIQIDILLM